MLKPLQATSHEDQCQAIIHKIGAAVDLISVILQEDPLSQPSAAKPEQAAYESPAPQAAPNSPLARAAQGSSPSQAQAALSSGAEPSSPPGEAARDSPANPAQTSAPSRRPPGAHTASAIPVEIATILNASRLDLQGSPDWWRSAQQECLDANDTDAGTPAKWQTPSAATWKQISTISVRAVHAMLWVSQVHTHCAGQTGEMSPLGQAVILMSANLLMTKLRQLLQQLLWGHFSDVTLDFQPILQAGLTPIVRLLERDEGYEGHVGLVVRCLERMTKDSMQGRVKEPADEDTRLEQLRSIFTLLGELNLNRNLSIASQQGSEGDQSVE